MAVISGIDFRSIFSSFHEGVIVADAGGTILYYNDAQGRIDDLPPGEAIGKKIVEVYDLTEAQSTTMRCLHTGRPITHQPIFYRTRLGRFANVVSNVYPIHAEGRLVGAISFTKDYQMVEKIVSPSSGKKPEAPGNGTRYAFGDIVGSSPGLRKAVETAKMASASPSAVMIFGETGTGKEIIAQSIHNHGPMRPRTFIPINCAAIPENLLEAILFGTSRGAFTGAVDRPGLFEEAASGTLFLDEINAMPLSLQAKLLRVVQEKRIRRIGSPSETPVDVKLVSSLNEDPYRAISRGTLRKDLFYRLGVVVIAMPPLRERRGDLSALACHFIDRSSRELKKSVAAVSENVMHLFQGYPWPGNIRELAHVIEGAMNVIGDGECVIDLKHLPRHIQSFCPGYDRREPSAPFPPFSCEIPAPSPPLPTGQDRAPVPDDGPPMETLARAKDSVEKEAIRRALRASGGNVARAARMLGILSPQSLHYKLKKYGLNRKDFVPR
ncbi:sigma-54 interaction domain-containing protein [Desulfococcus sp.]|uniref:sigma-54 interaction domain-containing protein n=1 Tax=Desulfococcus sp. TaxID=2025834 RepID=UPI003593ABC0